MPGKPWELRTTSTSRRLERLACHWWTRQPDERAHILEEISRELTLALERYRADAAQAAAESRRGALLTHHPALQASIGSVDALMAIGDAQIRSGSYVEALDAFARASEELDALADQTDTASGAATTLPLPDDADDGNPQESDEPDNDGSDDDDESDDDESDDEEPDDDESDDDELDDDELDDDESDGDGEPDDDDSDDDDSETVDRATCLQACDNQFRDDNTRWRSCRRRCP